MKKRIANIIICILFIIPMMTIITSGRTLSPEVSAKMDKYFASESTLLEPHAKNNGHPYKICYVDIDPYPPSGEMLYYLIKQLYDTGWIVFPEGKSITDLPFDPSDLDAGKFIDFVVSLDTQEYAMEEFYRRPVRQDIDLLKDFGKIDRIEFDIERSAREETDVFRLWDQLTGREGG